MEVFDREGAMAFVRKAVADSLALDPGQVRPDSRLVTDLGATSLDFIDLVFTLEKEFGVQIQESELEFLTKLSPAAGSTPRQDTLDDATLGRLKAWLPALSTHDHPERLSAAELFSMITVDTLVRLVESKKQA